MNIEITVQQATHEDLFNELDSNTLKGSAFPMDIIGIEYIAVPIEVVKTGSTIRSKLLLIEAD